jgi:hypothetical protein
MELYKTYVDTDQPNQKIRFSIYFNKETINWATGQYKDKGYQVTAIPVEKTGFGESFGAFTGFNDIIYPVQRQSKKRLQTAINMLHLKMDEYLKFFENKGYKVKRTQLK